MNFENKDVLTIDATVIVGLLILLTITSFVSAQNDTFKKLPFLLTPSFWSATITIPFIMSALFSISYKAEEIFGRFMKKSLTEEHDETKIRNRRVEAVKRGLKYMKIGFAYLLLMMFFMIILTVVMPYLVQKS